jgi:hypothetical protein
MTVEEFVQVIQYSYDYSKKPGQLSLIAEWVQKIPQDRLKPLSDRILDEISTEFNQVPDRSRLKALYKRMQEEFAFRQKADPNAKKIEYNQQAHRADVVDKFAELRDKLGMPAYGEK